MSLETVDTAALLPSAITADDDARALLAALDANWRAIAAALPLLPLIATLDAQPSEVIDSLAYQYHVDYYDQAMPLSTRRDLVRNAISFHRQAGTRGAVEDFIRTIWGDGASIREWFEVDPPLEPGVFLVTLSGSLAEADITEFLKSIRAVKRATDHVLIQTSGGTTAMSIPITASAVMSITQSYGTFEV
jgi:phage tail P2-like protein